MYCSCQLDSNVDLELRCMTFHGEGSVTSRKASTEDQIKLPRLGNVHFKNINLVYKFSIFEILSTGNS